ncbi:MAG: GxxExxY protein [Candidatus Omnitrophota bacterium]
MDKQQLDELSNKVIGIAIEVHKHLGPGFVEKIYQTALAYEFDKLNIRHNKEKEIQVKYKELYIGSQRIDFLIGDLIILELKCVSEINDIHLAQTISYLKAVDVKLGLILNFAKPRLEIKRVVNNI